MIVLDWMALHPWTIPAGAVLAAVLILAWWATLPEKGQHAASRRVIGWDEPDRGLPALEAAPVAERVESRSPDWTQRFGPDATSPGTELIDYAAAWDDPGCPCPPCAQRRLPHAASPGGFPWPGPGPATSAPTPASPAPRSLRPTGPSPTPSPAATAPASPPPPDGGTGPLTFPRHSTGLGITTFEPPAVTVTDDPPGRHAQPRVHAFTPGDVPYCGNCGQAGHWRGEANCADRRVDEMLARRRDGRATERINASLAEGGFKIHDDNDAAVESMFTRAMAMSVRAIEANGCEP
jgi:hypothetical protein